MTTFSSRVQILTIENETRKSKRTGADYEHFVARSILLADDGAVVTVGTLRVPPALREGLAVGTYRASFSLQVPDFGDNKGEIQAVLTALVPEPSPARGTAAGVSLPASKAPVAPAAGN